MEKIPFAENLAQHLPGSYNKNLALLNETQTKAMHEDNRRWRLAEHRYKARQDATNEAELTKANALIRTWLDGPHRRHTRTTCAAALTACEKNINSYCVKRKMW